ncbi:MAG TPA: hypothetical protein VGW33_03025 [Terriglobia bacterium]|nr:hypothetical protein [Terriglobia bacterium]
MKTCVFLMALVCGAAIAVVAGRSSTAARPAFAQQGPPNFPAPNGAPGPGSEPVLVHPTRPHPPGDFEGKPEDITPRRRFNAAQTRKDAEQLATLASKIPGEIDQVSKGALPKDLNQQLKQIGKLAKRLRGEVTP